MARQGYMLTYALFKMSHPAWGGSLLVTNIAFEMSTTYNHVQNLMSNRVVSITNPPTNVEMTIFPESKAYMVALGREWEAIQTVLTYPNAAVVDVHMVGIAGKREPGAVWQLVSPPGAPIMVICGNQHAYFISDEPGLVVSGEANGFSGVTYYAVNMTFDHYHNGVNYSAIRDDLETFDPEGYHAP